MEKAAVIMIVVLIIVVGIALLGFAEDIGVKVGEDSAAVEQVKDVWQDLTAPVSFDLDRLAQ